MLIYRSDWIQKQLQVFMQYKHGGEFITALKI